MAQTINCPECGYPNTLPAASCMYCDKDFGDVAEMIQLSASEQVVINQKAAQVILTTAHHLEGFRVVETLEIISAECVVWHESFP